MIPEDWDKFPPEEQPQKENIFAMLGDMDNLNDRAVVGDLLKKLERSRQLAVLRLARLIGKESAPCA